MASNKIEIQLDSEAKQVLENHTKAMNDFIAALKMYSFTTNNNVVLMPNLDQEYPTGIEAE